MEKSLFFQKQKKPNNKKLPRNPKAKIALYTKKLSSNSVHHRKKALFRLLQLDSKFLKKYSVKSGNFHLTDTNIFLTSVQQLDPLKSQLETICEDQLLIEENEHSNFFELDENGIIKPDIQVLSKAEWEEMIETQDFRELPDPKYNIFWRNIYQNESEKSDEKYDLDHKGKKQLKILHNVFQRYLKIGPKKIPSKPNKNFRIRSKSRTSQRPQSGSRSKRPKVDFKELNQSIKLNKNQLTLMECLQSLNQRTDSKISNADSSKFPSPPEGKRKKLDHKNHNRRSSFGFSKFRIKKRCETKQKQPKEEKSKLGRFELAVRKFMKERGEEEKRDRARSMKIRMRSYERRNRISVFN